MDDLTITQSISFVSNNLINIAHAQMIGVVGNETLAEEKLHKGASREAGGTIENERLTQHPPHFTPPLI